MNNDNILLEAVQTDASYGSRRVLHEISLSIKKGEVSVMIGPNGAGKSTLLRVLAGYLKPENGVVFIDGRDLRDYSALELAKKRAVLFTGSRTEKLLKVGEVTSEGRYPYTGRLGRLSDEDNEKVIKALRIMQAEDLYDDYFEQLSDGQKQRVLLARAIAQEPDILILDEPVSFLDIRYRIEFANEIRHLARRLDIAIVVSLHELSLVERIADTVICIKDGRIDSIINEGNDLSDDYIERLYDIPRGEYKKSPLGFTTGSAAALAAQAAARRLFEGSWQEYESIITPKGVRVCVPVEDRNYNKGIASCGIRKYAGDDPDATDGIVIYARVQRQSKEGITITGGEGVGRVTKPGLDQPVGEYAINSVPRRMISEAVLAICSHYGHEGGLAVEISAPGGEMIAKKTFNGELGIVGGISIIGTSGIVEPMSEDAIIESVRVGIRQKKALGHRRLVLVLGNYGQEYIEENHPEIDTASIVKCSNFVGEAVKFGSSLGFDEILLAGHIGKIIKIAGGMTNTHSKYGDCRRDIMTSHAAAAGAGTDILRRLFEAATTEDGVAILNECGMKEPVMHSIAEEIKGVLQRRTEDACSIRVIMFSRSYGFLAEC